MKAYKQIRADIARLEREAEAARRAESAGVVAKIRKLVAEYGLTAADIGLDSVRQESSASSGSPPVKAASKKAARKTAAKKASRSGAGVAKYRDPKSGKTWTGFGRAPQWLASAKKRDAFLIGSGDGQGETSVAARAQPSVKTTARKAWPAGKAAKRPAARKRATAATDTTGPALLAQ